MKNSFSSLELIASIIISSIVIVYSMLFIKESMFSNTNNQEIEIVKLDLLSTKVFLQKHNNLESKLKFENKTLYFENSILLKDVYNFEIIKQKKYYEIHINLKNKIKQIWKIKL